MGPSPSAANEPTSHEPTSHDPTILWHAPIFHASGYGDEARQFFAFEQPLAIRAEALQFRIGEAGMDRLVADRMAR